jgi:hypothetical protein
MIKWSMLDNIFLDIIEKDLWLQGYMRRHTHIINSRVMLVRRSLKPRIGMEGSLDIQFKENSMNNLIEFL